MSEPITGTLLYIEDDPVNLMVVSGMLDAHPGVRLLHAATGIDGVRQVQQERPDMVLLDMHLPDISGLEVIRRIDHLIAGRGLRVSILTGDPMNLDIVKAMSLGAFEYWSKPLDRHLFEDGLRRGLSGAGAHPARSLPAASPFPAPHDR